MVVKLNRGFYMSSVSNPSRVHLDMSYEEKVLKLIEEIKSTEEEELFQPLEPIDNFYVTINKVDSPEIRGRLFQRAFETFSIQSNVQWFALELAKKQGQQKNTYLYNLLEACKTTNNQEMAFQAAQELDVDRARKDIVTENLTEHFRTGSSKSLFRC